MSGAVKYEVPLLPFSGNISIILISAYGIMISERSPTLLKENLNEVFHDDNA